MSAPIWTIRKVGEEEKRTFAELGISGIQKQSISQKAGSVSFQIPGDCTADPLFNYRDRVEIFRDDVRWFYGRCKLPKATGNGTAEGISYELEDPWCWLEGLTYQQEWNATGVNGALVPFRQSHVILYQNLALQHITVIAQIRDALDYVIAAGRPIQYAIDFPDFALMVSEEKGMQCADVIRRPLRWVPNVVTYWDFTTDGIPTLRIKDRATLGTVSLDASATKATHGYCIQDIEVTPRADLQKDAIVLKFESTSEVNGITQSRLDIRVAPDNGLAIGSAEYLALVETSEVLENAVMETINLRGSQTAFASAPLVTADLLPNSVAWWKNQHPELDDAKVKEFKLLGLAVQHTDLPYYVVAGAVADWMTLAGGAAVQGVRDVITVEASWIEVDEMDQTHNETRRMLLTADITATNGPSGLYQSITGFVEADPIPEGLAQAVYDASSVLQFEGKFTIVEQDCSGRVQVGQTVNLINDKPERATMNALVQQVIEDFDSGTTTIIFGPAEHLGATDLAELCRETRTRFVYTASSVRAGTSSGTGEVKLARSSARANSTSGGRIVDKLVIAPPAKAVDGQPANPNWGVTLAAKVIQIGTDQNIQLNLDHANGKQIKLREVSYCDNGVAKKMLVFGSDLYT